MRRGRHRPLGERKARDRALILPVIGALLLLPPVARIFALDAAIAGVPLAVLYVFTVWAGLIAGAVLLAHRLPEPEPDSDGNAGKAGESG